MNFGIRQKLLIGFVVIILLFTGSCFVGLSYIQLLIKSLEFTLDHPMVESRASQDIEVLIVSMQRNMYGISIAQNKTDIDILEKEIRTNEKNALGLISLIQKKMMSNNGKMLALKARLNFYQWRPIRNEAIKDAEKGRFDRAQEINTTKGDPYVHMLQSEMDSLGNFAENRAKLFSKDSHSIASHARVVVILTILLSILIGLLASFKLSASLTRRLRSISMATSDMAKGNINQSLEIKGNDELTLVAGNFNLMAKQLSGIKETLEKKVLERTAELNETNLELNRVKSELEGKVIERTKDLEEKINELNRSQLAMLYMIEDMNETSRQLKATQEELIRKERLAILGQFSGNISHELRNPLGVIDSSIYYLQMRLTEKDEKVLQHLDRISKSVKNATTIIENLLSLTRMNKPVLTRYSLTKLIEECLKSCKIQDTITVEQDFQASEMMVKAEKEQMRMAIDNIVKNAISAMNGKGTLTIITRENNEGQAEISFIDTGSGINPDHFTQVFLPLFSTKAKGIGLGLSITKMIIENHGGKISADAQPGKGAKFIIRLPLFSEGKVETLLKEKEKNRPS